MQISTTTHVANLCRFTPCPSPAREQGRVHKYHTHLFHSVTGSLGPSTAHLIENTHRNVHSDTAGTNSPPRADNAFPPGTIKIPNKGNSICHARTQVPFMNVTDFEQPCGMRRPPPTENLNTVSCRISISSTPNKHKSMHSYQYRM